MIARFACWFEWNMQRLTKSTQCMVLSGAEGEANGELSTARKVQPASQSNVAVQCFIVLPIEAIVVSQVGPAVIHADVSTRRFGERNRSANCKPRVSLMGEQNLVIPNL